MKLPKNQGNNVYKSPNLDAAQNGFADTRERGKHESVSVPSQIDQMTLAEKLRTMETLWDDLCQREADVPVPLWQKAILDERERLIEQGKARFSNWETARKRLSK